MRGMRLLLALGLVLFVVGCGDQQRFAAVPQPLPDPGTPLLGAVDRGHGKGSIVRLAPATLARASKPIRLSGYLWGAGWSPDRRSVAIGVSARGRVQVIDVAGWHDRGVISLHAKTAAPYVSWPRDDRVLALGFPTSERTPGWVLDPGKRSIVRRFSLPGGNQDAAVTPFGFAALLGSFDAIVAARLALVDHEGATRIVSLPGVRSGSSTPDADGLGREVRPALAVDSRRAFVVDAEKLRVLEVDIATAKVTTHDLSPKSVIASIDDWLEPAAYAKGGEGPSRFARLVGRNLLAISGYKMHGHDNPRYDDLLLVDTNTWATRRVPIKVDFVTPAGDAMLAFETRGGIVAVDLDGRRLWSRKDVVRVETAGQRAYLTIWRPRHATLIVDARSGRRLGRLSTARSPVLVPRPR